MLVLYTHRIGRHAAESLANQGYVVLAGVRKKDDAKSLRDMNIDTLVPVFLDVTDEDACIAVVDKIKEMTRKTSLPLVALVNNAGMSCGIVMIRDFVTCALYYIPCTMLLHAHYGFT